MNSNAAGLQELSPDIWISERKLRFGGVHLRSRMTAIRLADGRLWVHSASEPTPALCAELDRVLGQYQNYNAPPDVPWNTGKGPDARQSVEQISKLPLERTLVAQSDLLEDRPVERLKEAWRLMNQ